MQETRPRVGKKLKVEPFWIEERVYLCTDNIWMKTRSRKLSNKSIEPFKIVRNIKKISYELNLLKKIWIHSVFHTFMLQHCNQTILLQITETPVKSDEEYEIEDILGKRMISEEVHYLVKWKDYNISENIWELKENLKNCVRTLQCFKKRIELSLRRLMT